jgi:hypothetical protein
VRYSLIIKFRGLSLWLDRRTHFDVLFPRAELVPPVEQHFVAWTADLKVEHSMDRVVLDLTGLPAIPDPKPSLDVPGVLAVEVKPDSLAHQPDAVFGFTYCTAGFRLPYGLVTPLLEPFTGPCAYNGSENVFVAHGVEWRGLCDGDAGVTGQLKQSAADPGQSQLLGIVDGGTKSLELLVECRSQADMAGTAPDIRYGELIEDFPAYSWLLSPVNATKYARMRPPQYLGGEFTPMHFRASMARRYTLRRPCPPVHGVPS